LKISPFVSLAAGGILSQNSHSVELRAILILSPRDLLLKIIRTEFWLFETCQVRKIDCSIRSNTFSKLNSNFGQRKLYFEVIKMCSNLLRGEMVVEEEGNDEEVGEREQEGGEQRLVQVHGQHGEGEEDERHAGGDRVVRCERHQ